MFTFIIDISTSFRHDYEITLTRNQGKITPKKERCNTMKTDYLKPIMYLRSTDALSTAITQTGEEFAAGPEDCGIDDSDGDLDRLALRTPPAFQALASNSLTAHAEVYAVTTINTTTNQITGDAVITYNVRSDRVIAEIYYPQQNLTFVTATSNIAYLNEKGLFIPNQNNFLYVQEGLTAEVESAVGKITQGYRASINYDTAHVNRIEIRDLSRPNLRIVAQDDCTGDASDPTGTSYTRKQ